MAISSHVMTLSRNGQVSIPAEARSRWNVRHLIVVDLGDRVVMRPMVNQPIDELEGKYRGRGSSSVQARRRAQLDERAHDKRR